jgi:magnesium chelatase subunit I
VTLSQDALKLGLNLVRQLDVDSHRAEYTMFEAARAYAAADGRDCAGVSDIRAVAPMALRQRRSQFMVDFAHQQQTEDDTIRDQIDSILGSNSR